jgi:hypothetical protein
MVAAALGMSDLEEARESERIAPSGRVIRRYSSVWPGSALLKPSRSGHIDSSPIAAG